MKAIASLLFAGALTAAAQTPPPASKPADISDPTAVIRELRAGTTSRPLNPSVSGAVVQAVRVRNPLKLIDPRAPRELANGYDNLAGAPARGRVEGIKLFAISF